MTVTTFLSLNSALLPHFMQSESISLLQGIFLIWGSNSGLPYCRQICYHLSHWGSPKSKSQYTPVFDDTSVIWKYTHSHHNPVLLKHWALATLAFLTFIDYSNYSVIFPLAILSSSWKANLYAHMMDFFF